MSFVFCFMSLFFGGFFYNIILFSVKRAQCNIIIIKREYTVIMKKVMLSLIQHTLAHNNVGKVLSSAF